MSLILRNVVNRPLTWAEGDANFTYLLTNMSGSTINITGSTINIASNGLNLTDNNWAINSNGSGNLASNKISWSTNGNLTITGSLVASGSSHNIKGNTVVTGSLAALGSSHNLAHTNGGALLVQDNIVKSQFSTDNTDTGLYMNIVTDNFTCTLGDYGDASDASVPHYFSITYDGSNARANIPNTTLFLGNGLVTTGSLVASGSGHTLRGTTNIIGSTTVTGSLVASGSSHILRGTTTLSGSASTSLSISNEISVNVVTGSTNTDTRTGIPVVINGINYIIPLWTRS